MFDLGCVLVVRLLISKDSGEKHKVVDKYAEEIKNRKQKTNYRKEES